MFSSNKSQIGIFLLSLSWLASSNAEPPFRELIEPNRTANSGFGDKIITLATGNIVVTAPLADKSGITDVGAVYLYDGATGTLISSLTGSSQGDMVGSDGVVALPNGDFVIISPQWDNPSGLYAEPAPDAGAVTFVNGLTGTSGAVSIQNSLVGRAQYDRVGEGGVLVLSNGNYLVLSPNWDLRNEGSTARDEGAITWVNGAVAIKGLVSSSNSLVGASDKERLRQVCVLANGNYVVASATPMFSPDSYKKTHLMSVTWADGKKGIRGMINKNASLITYHNGYLNSPPPAPQIQALTNGNYLVINPSYDIDSENNFGSVTWVNGTTGLIGSVNSNNSLIGNKAGDAIGSGGVVELYNGNYVVVSPKWQNVDKANAGAVTWGDGIRGSSGVISAANSLVGSSQNDQVGVWPYHETKPGRGGGITPLPNGNYVVRSPMWNHGGVAEAGAVTWCSGERATAEVVSSSNSLVGSSSQDRVGIDGVTVLVNGNYVVSSMAWKNGSRINAGAVTWANANAGISGPVSEANSLVGAFQEDNVGSGGVIPLKNGNYVVSSPLWYNGASIRGYGAVTFCLGSEGRKGLVNINNSLVGTLWGDYLGSGGVAALSDGNYAVSSPAWDGVDSNGFGVGAVTWCDGSLGRVGLVNQGNSMLGDYSDRIGNAGIVPLKNGSYLIRSLNWRNRDNTTDWGGINFDAGAVTWCKAGETSTGIVSAANSLVGWRSNDRVGLNVTVLANGNYVIGSSNWANGPLDRAGAVTWGSMSGGHVGLVSVSNSLIGSESGEELGEVIGHHGVVPLNNGNYLVSSGKGVSWSDGNVAGLFGTDPEVLIRGGFAGLDNINNIYYVRQKLVDNIDRVMVGSQANGLRPSPEITVTWKSVQIKAGEEEPSSKKGTAFGVVTLKTESKREFIISNRGTKPLILSSASFKSNHESAFGIEGFVNDQTLDSGESAKLIIKFAPVSPGLKFAEITVVNNDSDESDFSFVISGQGGATPEALLVTMTATQVSPESVLLAGEVDAKDYERSVSFDWGSTESYGNSVSASPAIINGSGKAKVTAVLSNLIPHLTYHYRVKATNASGTQIGKNGSITLNTKPSATHDSFTIVPGSTVTLPVLTNDLDADGDVLSLATHADSIPKSAGKLTKVGNTFVFAATSSFTTASFSYTCKDAFKGTSASATVTLTAGTASLNPPTVTQASAGISYPVALTATGMWSMAESLPWVTVSPFSGEGDGSVMVTLLPNAAKAERKGIVMIGGKQHSITQQGVVQPTLSLPAIVPEPEVVDGFTLMPPAAVGSLYSLTLPTTGFPVSHKVTKMPPGLTINGNTGVMSGRPTAGGTYDMTIQANNAAGTSAVLKLRIVVAALHPGLVGTFHGFIDCQSSLNAGLGSRFELTMTTMGSFSGKWITGTTSVPFAKGQINVEIADANHPSATIVIPRTKSSPLTLELDFSAEDDALTGTLSDVSANSTSVEAWRNPWSRTNPAPDYYKVRHSFLLEQGDTAASLPQGFGYGSFDPITPATGAVTIKGLLADGSIYATTSFLGRKGELLIYQPLYGNRGSVLGKIVLTPHNATPADHSISGTLNCWKPSPLPNSKEVIYRSGFGPLALTVEGGDCPPVTPGGLILGLTGTSEPQAVIQFSEGGLPGNPPTFSHSMKLNNPSPKGLTNKATLNTNAPNGLKMTALDAAKGGFSGEFTMPTGRKAPFTGQLVKRAGIWGGYGYFLLPEVPEGSETVTTSPRNSGKVRLSPQ